MNERDAVLALSPEAGAWERLHEARRCAVPPFDVAGTADALHRRPRRCPPAERAERAADAARRRRGAHPGRLARRPARRRRLTRQPRRPSSAAEERRARPRARRPRGRPEPSSSGAASAVRTATFTVATPVAGQAVERGEGGQVAHVVTEVADRAQPRRPGLARRVPLSTATGGWSSTDILASRSSQARAPRGLPPAHARAPAATSGARGSAA